MPESRDEKTEISTAAQLQSCELGLSITRRAWTKLMAYCRAAKSEVSGFMLLERDGDLLWIDDVYLVGQVCTGTSTEMDRTAIAKFQLDLYKKKIIGFEGCKKRLAHFHTHYDFNVFWSGTDMEMRHLNRQGVDYFVSLVINQKGDALAAIDINGEFPMSINNLPIEIVDENHAELIKACQAEVELKVKSPSYTVREYQGYDGNYGGPGDTMWPRSDSLPGMADERDVPPRHYLEDKDSVTLLGPKDRRRLSKAERKAQAKLEKLTRELRAETGSIPWHQYKAKQDALDRARAAIRQAQTMPGLDDIHIDGDEHASGDVWSDAGGTYQNIGGEIVKIEEATPLD